MREQLEALERKWRANADSRDRGGKTFSGGAMRGCADDLRTLLDGCAGEVEALKQQLAAAREALQAAEADAARFRFLHSHTRTIASGIGGCLHEFPTIEDPTYSGVCATIDATLQRDRQP